MTLIVETGASVVDANSYVSLLEADTYHALYYNSDWDGLSDADKEQHLILATRSIDANYASKFLSLKKNDINELCWPRLAFLNNNNIMIADNTIPKALKNAVCEVALMSSLGLNLFPASNNDDNVKINKTKIGDLAIEKEYFSSSKKSSEEKEGFNTIELFLWTILKLKNKTLTLNR